VGINGRSGFLFKYKLFPLYVAVVISYGALNPYWNSVSLASSNRYIVLPVASAVIRVGLNVKLPSMGLALTFTESPVYEIVLRSQGVDNVYL
jgi:hypothetical protein